MAGRTLRVVKDQTHRRRIRRHRLRRVWSEEGVGPEHTIFRFKRVTAQPLDRQHHRPERVPDFRPGTVIRIRLAVGQSRIGVRPFEHDHSGKRCEFARPAMKVSDIHAVVPACGSVQTPVFDVQCIRDADPAHNLKGRRIHNQRHRIEVGIGTVGIVVAANLHEKLLFIFAVTAAFDPPLFTPDDFVQEPAGVGERLPPGLVEIAAGGINRRILRRGGLRCGGLSRLCGGGSRDLGGRNVLRGGRGLRNVRRIRLALRPQNDGEPRLHRDKNTQHPCTEKIPSPVTLPGNARGGFLTGRRRQTGTGRLRRRIRDAFLTRNI